MLVTLVNMNKNQAELKLDVLLLFDSLRIETLSNINNGIMFACVCTESHNLFFRHANKSFQML